MSPAIIKRCLPDIALASEQGKRHIDIRNIKPVLMYFCQKKQMRYTSERCNSGNRVVNAVPPPDRGADVARPEWSHILKWHSLSNLPLGQGEWGEAPRGSATPLGKSSQPLNSLNSLRSFQPFSAIPTGHHLYFFLRLSHEINNLLYFCLKQPFCPFGHYNSYDVNIF